MTRPGLGRLALRNLLSRPVRHGILILCAAAVVGAQVAAGLLDRASQAGLQQGLARLGADLVVVPRDLDQELIEAYLSGRPALFYLDRSLRQRIEALDFVERTSAQVFLKSLTGASCCSAWNVFLVGFEPESDFTIRPWLSRRPSRSLGPDELLVGAALGVDAGTRLKFYGHQFTVAGVLDPTGMGLDSTVFIPIETAYLMARESTTKAEKPLELEPGRVSAILVRLKPPEQGGLPAYRAAYELEMAIPEISVIQPDDLAQKTRANLFGVLGRLRTAGYAAWPVAALLVGLVFAMAVNERRREIGLLRALGASRGFVFKLIVMEAALIAGLAAVLGAAVAVGLVGSFARLIAASLEVPFLWPGATELAGLILGTVALALATGVAAALVPAVQSARLEPYEAMRRE